MPEATGSGLRCCGVWHLLKGMKSCTPKLKDATGVLEDHGRPQDPPHLQGGAKTTTLASHSDDPKHLSTHLIQVIHADRLSTGLASMTEASCVWKPLTIEPPQRKSSGDRRSGWGSAIKRTHLNAVVSILAPPPRAPHEPIPRLLPAHLQPAGRRVGQPH
ncbi:hypothetical protein VTK56DRAFT_7280 [Thermocarpiscus australiensis]